MLKRRHVEETEEPDDPGPCTVSGSGTRVFPWEQFTAGIPKLYEVA